MPRPKNELYRQQHNPPIVASNYCARKWHSTCSTFLCSIRKATACTPLCPFTIYMSVCPHFVTNFFEFFKIFFGHDHTANYCPKINVADPVRDSRVGIVIIYGRPVTVLATPTATWRIFTPQSSPVIDECKLRFAWYPPDNLEWSDKTMHFQPDNLGSASTWGP